MRTMEDLAGRVYGIYTVIKYLGKNKGNHFWECRCGCGNIRKVARSGLVSGRSKSCGCVKKNKETNFHKVINGAESKYCYNCKEWKPISLFHADKHSTDGLAKECKQCARKRLFLYRRQHPEVLKRQNERKRSSVVGKLTDRMATGIRESLTKGKQGRRWETLAGFTVNDLRKRLSDTMPKGYTWDDLNRLHIDHVIPISAFNITAPDCLDFKRCWSLSNLRLLPAVDNMSKGKTLDHPFQPSLSIGVC